MSTYVLYHANCPDGHGAAWVAWTHFKRQGIEDVTYLPVSYGNPMPDIPAGSDVYILDFSYKRGEMFKLLGRSKSVKVIDHHKTAEADLKGFPNATFDMNHSGAVLAWMHFYPNKPTLSLLDYVEDRDLWKFSLSHSQEVNAWIGSYPRDFEVWSKLAVEIGPKAIEEGAAILRFKDQKVEEICDHAVCVSWDDYGIIPTVNTSCLMSEVANELLKKFPDSPFSCYWFDKPNNQRQWGLRSRPDFDCSVVAKEHGGGGHPQASGFVTETAEMEVGE